ncbi:MAG: type IX secretion system membrane protein PorP/SprF [Candidatus Azobacteroides sp.]|nr:type IX secretion system membrane protein PorP/SprF [Candidatus Azobacteroides sp.]
MKKIFFILIVFLGTGISSLQAQFDTQVSNYWAVTNYFNPGYAGQSGKLEVTGLYRMQWLGVEHAPKTGMVAGEMPFLFGGREHGGGLVLYNDQIGLFKSTLISVQYAFKVKLRNGHLGIGIQGGYINESFDGTKVEIPGDDDYPISDDEAIPASLVSGKSIDGAVGLYYAAKKGYVGLSVTHLIAPKLALNENHVHEIPRTYYLTMGYNIRLNNSLLELQPSVLLKTVELSSFYISGDSLVEVTKGNVLKGMLKQTQVDISLRMSYNKMFWGGVSWRKGESMIFMLGGKFKILEVGYAYDVPVFSRIIQVSSGSHEVFVKYSMDMNFKKGTKSKHKSVRIL